MRQNQNEQENKWTLNNIERDLIEYTRCKGQNPPSRDEFDQVLAWREQQKQKARDLASFLDEHQHSLSGAIHKLIECLLIQEDVFDIEGVQQAAHILYAFNTILQAPPEMDL